MRFLFRLSSLFCFSVAELLAQSPDTPLPFQLNLIGSNMWAAIDDAKGDALVGAVLPELTEKYGSWEFFKDFSRSNILDAGAELQGTKRIPVAQKK
ncbi:MAG TPA: hypothetical protein VNY24_05635 [Candidatus Acidoferrales bacterium]|jgi:hypothetical protein|nr:hypothetical protein [Candidatus Acidoferrales bacterium]